MAIKIRRFTASRQGGDVFVELQSFQALPMEGVLSTLERQIIEPEPRLEPTVITWRLPAEEGRYILYGVITPLRKLWRKPSYLRSVTQDGVLCKTWGQNPARFRARKQNRAEWVGPPEVIAIKVK